MKKFFVFCAAVAAAVGMQAEVINFASGYTNTNAHADEIKALYSLDGDGASWGVYNDSLLCVDAAEGANFTLAVGDNLEFKFATSNGKSAIIVFKKDYMEFGGKGMELRYYGEADDVVKMAVSSKSKSKASEFEIMPVSSTDDTPTATTTDALVVSTYTSKAEEASILTFKATDNEMKIKEIQNGYRLFSVEVPGEAQGVLNTEATAKATKAIVDGRIVVLRGNRTFDLTGRAL